MDHVRLAYTIAAACCAVVVLQASRAALGRWWRRRAMRRRGERARRGERVAESLLAAHGYRVEARQPRLAWTIYCDGDPRDIALRADLLVTCGRRRYVAEVKTGRVAPRIESAATRRQLLEYSLAYDADGVLLVDAEAGRVTEVQFPRAARPARGAASAVAFAAAFVCGALAGAVVTLWFGP